MLSGANLDRYLIFTQNGYIIITSAKHNTIRVGRRAQVIDILNITSSSHTKLKRIVQLYIKTIISAPREKSILFLFLVISDPPKCR